MNAKAKDTEITKNAKVTVVMHRISNVLPSLFPNEPKTRTYTGTVVGRADFDPPDSIRILDHNQPRVLMFRDIITWDGKPFHYTSTVVEKAAVAQPQYVKVAGSKGNEYTITIFPDGSQKCSCPGFGFRGTCKHIQAYNEDQVAQKADEPVTKKRGKKT